MKEGDKIQKPSGKVVVVGYNPSPAKKLINELIQNGVKAEPVSRELTFKVLKNRGQYNQDAIRYAITYMEDDENAKKI